MLGTRQAGLLVLGWSDVHLDARAAYVRRRTVPLPDQVVDALKSQKARQNLAREQAGEFWEEPGPDLHDGHRHSSVTSERLPGVQKDHRACRTAPCPSP
jgi:integrase